MSQASYRKFVSEQLKLAYQVKAAFYDYYFIGRELSITRENMELLKFWESVVNSKYKVGLKQHPDLMKVQVELGKLEDNLRTLQEMLEPAAARMRALLDLPDSIAIPVPAAIEVTEAELADDSVLSAIKRENPDLQAMQFMIEKEKAGVSLAKKEALPSFSIGVDYIQTGEALNPTIAESGKDAWIIAGSISLPIWFGKNGARKGEAVARQYQAEYNRRESENQLIAMGERILFEYSDALRKTRLYRDGLVPKAQQSLNASYAAYEAGKEDFLNVLDAERQLLDFELTVVREKAALATKRAQLEMLSGRSLDRYIQE
jgi:cobalt-zinc-cadmium efflux system outer membrane protein